MLLSATFPSDAREATLWRSLYSAHNFAKLVVLDPFMGGGTSIVESVKVGARVIGIDVDPVAWFVTKKEVDPCDLRLLRREAKAVLDKVGNSVSRFYMTKCPQGHLA